MKKTALILFTGDRVEFLDLSIKSCIQFLEKNNIKTEVDIFLISWNVDLQSIYTINKLTIPKPSDDEVKTYPMTRQILQYNEKDRFRINYGMYILFNQVPDMIHQQIQIFSQYDYILKCRSDLVFESPSFNYDENNLYTFECFWGGCRYNPNYTNDHFIFGKAGEVLKVIGFPKNESNPSPFWNPEQYMTFLFLKSTYKKTELTTDKYYLLSKDRESRKFIGYPMESINERDIRYFESIGLEWKIIKFTNKYDF
jgi:hypothetical protein